MDSLWGMENIINVIKVSVLVPQSEQWPPPLVFPSPQTKFHNSAYALDPLTKTTSRQLYGKTANESINKINGSVWGHVPHQLISGVTSPLLFLQALGYGGYRECALLALEEGEQANQKERERTSVSASIGHWAAFPFFQFCKVKVFVCCVHACTCAQLH